MRREEIARQDRIDRWARQAAYGLWLWLPAVAWWDGHPIIAAALLGVGFALIRLDHWLFLSGTLLLLILGTTTLPLFRDPPAAFRWAPLVIHGLLGARILYDRRWTRRWAPGEPAVVVFLALALLSIIWSVDRAATLGRVGTLILLAIAIFVVLGPKLEDPRWTARFLALVFAFCGTLLVASLVSAARDGPSVYAVGMPRYYGIFANSNWSGLLVALLFPFALWWAGTQGRMRVRMFAIVLVATLLLGLVVSAHRTSMLAVAVGAFVMLPRSWVRVVALVGAVAATLFVADLALGGPLSSSEAGSYLRLSSPLGGRADLWGLGLSIVAQDPLIGHGFGTEGKLMPPEVLDRHPLRGDHFHSSYIGMAAQLGLVGTLLFFGPLIVALASTRTRDAAEASLLVRALRGSLVAGLVVGIGESWIYVVGHGFTFIYWATAVAFLRQRGLPDAKGLRAAGASSHAGPPRSSIQEETHA